MTALRACVHPDGSQSYSFWCPGCEGVHNVPYGEGAGPRWTFNGNVDAPTFGPSLLITTGHYVPNFAERVPSLECACNWLARHPGEEPWPWPCSICHSFVVDGQIQFLGDCTHALAGQTVPLPLDWR